MKKKSMIAVAVLVVVFGLFAVSCGSYEVRARGELDVDREVLVEETISEDGLAEAIDQMTTEDETSVVDWSEEEAGSEEFAEEGTDDETAGTDESVVSEEGPSNQEPVMEADDSDGKFADDTAETEDDKTVSDNEDEEVNDDENSKTRGGEKDSEDENDEASASNEEDADEEDVIECDARYFCHVVSTRIVDNICRIAACEAWTYDRDGRLENGCECVSMGREVCDGYDNDCDGMVDEGLKGERGLECKGKQGWVESDEE